MCNLVSKATTSPKKLSRDHDPRQKPDTKRWICRSELLVAFEPRNSLLVIPWVVCNGLERLRHGFRRVSSHETTKTSVEVRYAYSEVRMSQLQAHSLQNNDNLLGSPKNKVSEENLHQSCCKPCGFWTTFLGAYGLALAEAVRVFYGVQRVISRDVTAATSVV